MRLAEARKRVSEERERRFVEPLEIVDAEQEPAFLCEALERIQERERDETVVVRIGPLCDSERRLERPLLRRRQASEHVIGNAADQVRETRERIGRFRLRRAARQRQITSGRSGFHCGEPDRGLPDSGLACDHRHCGQSLDIVE